jgi:DNA-directed RNA polymerase specialized sigma24 family protein
VRRKNRYEGLDALVGERGSALLGTAVLLAGSRAAGEDCYRRRWSAWCVTGPGSGATRKGYLRRTMYHLAVDQWRSRGRRPEVLRYWEQLSAAEAAEVLEEQLTEGYR